MHYFNQIFMYYLISQDTCKALKNILTAYKVNYLDELHCR